MILARGKMQRISEVEVSLVPIEDSSHISRIVQRDVRQAEYVTECLADRGRLQVVHRSQHPRGFENDRVGDQDLRFCKPCLTGLELRSVVARH